MFIITQAELEHLNEYQLRQLYTDVLTDLAKRSLSARDCPLTMMTLENIQTVLRKKRALRPPV